jgi:cellulose synthase/poly-beta-1,6-N-acetylglucosamine synthase-like glycosyltransferase
MRLLKKLGPGIGIFALPLLFPPLHFAIVAVNFVAHALVMGLQLVVSRFSIAPPSKALPIEDEPFVSIHVPIHNEPPEIVFQTLHSLSNLKWSNYEVLVIDNNTSDPNLWQPVQKYCAELGGKFRFFHVENLPGFKAGAMNYVRRYMDSRASFIFVIDADYCVKRKALRTALSYFTSERIGLIQFPQDYRNVSKANLGIALDYKHFFCGFMNVANYLECVPSTGTLALLNVKALEDLGGFDTRVVTEDADLGLRLTLNGYKSIYVNEVIGSGLMPHELDGLKKQRWRWAFGNAQILMRNWRELFLSPALSTKQKLGFMSHLTAWFSFNLIPTCSLILLSFYSLARDLSPSQIYTVLLSGFTLCTYLVLKYGVLHYSLRRDGHTLPEIWKAFATHLGLGWVFSASWVRCVFNRSSPFIRTNKFLSVVPGMIQSTSAELALGVGLFSAAIILTLTDFVLGPIAALLMCGARFAIYWVGAQTNHTWKLTTRLFQPQEES